MANRKVTVVISQAQGKNPTKLALEEELAAQLLMAPYADVSLVPHLYDLSADHTGMLFLKSVPGDLVVLSWLYPRAARWILDRSGVKGQEGVSLLVEDDDEQDDESTEPERNGIGALDIPDRNIYCIDLRVSSNPQDYLEEIERISQEKNVQTVDLMQWIQGAPKAEQLQMYLNPLPFAQATPSPNGSNGPDNNGNGNGAAKQAFQITTADQSVGRRWYPVIDYSRCTNCMECIDFCLFGVYGVDPLDRILVEEQDNCKKGCPACSRVCPENAIIFPGHKSPGIAGSDGEVAGLKIDLSKLFGGEEKSLDMAVQERDAELVKEGRDAVGMTVGIPKRQTGKENTPKDQLDDLIDSLDDLDL